MRGIKDAYKAVSSESDDINFSERAVEDGNPVLKTAEVISGLLLDQKKHIVDEYNILPEKAKDNYSLGYVGGFADAILQRKGVEMDEAGTLIMAIVFINIFGEDQGPLYIRKLIALQDADDREVFNGMQRGGEEVFAWLSNEEKKPLGWLSYTSEKN